MKTYRITIRETKLSFFEVSAPTREDARQLWERGLARSTEQPPHIVEAGIFSIHEILPKL